MSSESHKAMLKLHPTENAKQEGMSLIIQDRMFSCYIWWNKKYLTVARIEELGNSNKNGGNKDRYKSIVTENVQLLVFGEIFAKTLGIAKGISLGSVSQTH